MRPIGQSWKRSLHQGSIVLVVLALLFLAPVLLPSSSHIAAQTRPTLTPPRPTLTPSFPGNVSGAPTDCESFYGRVINLENDTGEPGQAVHFTGPIDNWFVGVPSEENGYYTFGRLGTDMGFLNLYIPEENGLHRITTDIALAPVPGQCLVANLGFYRNHWAAPPLAPTIYAQPAYVALGGTVTFVVKVRNSLSYDISGVIVTDNLPEGLLLTEVTTGRGGTQRLGNYGAAFIGPMASLESVTVQFTAIVAPGATPGTVRNQVSLLYREHAAAQASALVTIGSGASPTATASGAGAQATPYATAVPTARVATHTPTPTAEANNGALLPVTGYGLTAIVAGLALGIIALAARYIRQRRQAVPSLPED